MRYRRVPDSAEGVQVTFNPSFLRRMPLIVPRTVWALCRHRHKAHYADAQIMPICVGNPACVAEIAGMESA